MQVKGLTEQQLRDAATEVGVDLDMDLIRPEHWSRVKVLPLVTVDLRTPSGYRKKGEAGDTKYQRESWSSGASVHAVCWHGFRDFFRACFKRNPDALFKTAMATWCGSDDFERRYQDTGMKDVGSMMQPALACDVCRCPERGEV